MVCRLIQPFTQVPRFLTHSVCPPISPSETRATAFPVPMMDQVDQRSARQFRVSSQARFVGTNVEGSKPVVVRIEKERASHVLSRNQGLGQLSKFKNRS